MDQVERLDPQRRPETAPGSVSRPVPGLPGGATWPPLPSPTIAILTALASEFAAVTAVLRQARPVPEGPAGDPNHYLAGKLPSRDPDTVHHVVATVLPYDGNRSAAVVATDVLRSFPTIRCVIFSGIAGGVPDAERPAEDVRLGDVLVAVDGVVDYDHTATVDGEDQPRRQLQGLSADMLRAVQELRAAHTDPGVPLKQELDRVTDPRFARPGERTRDSRLGTARVHFGAIGSAERLLRDATLRDQLARRHGIKGVEMEASGLAVGASLRGVPWFVVRGVSDYCDNLKDDIWHDYASLTSAAFVAVLLRYCRPLGADHPMAAERS
jgi:nucleoside phosphorylase